jgi:prephenate dehydrogenase
VRSLRDWFFFRLLLAQMLIKRDRGRDLDRAMRVLQELRTRITRKQHPRWSAQIDALRALAYERQAKGNRQENLRNALKAYNDALKAISKEGYPELWADYALANSYAFSEYGSSAANIRKAAEHYRNALEVVSAERESQKRKGIEQALRELDRQRS